MAGVHLLAIPYPAQGHVIPLMELSQCLAERGCRVTFVNTEFDHRRVVNTLADDKLSGGRIRLVSIPDGMKPEDNRNDLGRLCQAILRVMPGKLRGIIEEINQKDEDNKITCMIADLNMAWALEVAKGMGIPGVAFWPAAAAILVCGISIPKMIGDGVISEDGTPLKDEMIELGPNMPVIRPEHLVWRCIGDFETQQIVIDYMLKNAKIIEDVEWQVCNTSIILEPGALANYPRLLPIGPLIAHHRHGKRALELKEKVVHGVRQGGDSYNNFNNLVDWLTSAQT
ncbi:hypothetical protein MLD38_033876 [Melastoma candidum]|uniref:Uncharacterized protein n=1 Tax=Melastoma candidum TaxID=119954 RepID=A0ACB9MAG5_9MYRT|nr:hypothetical protein MLD38_033876 [Melastoma candidum]